MTLAWSDEKARPTRVEARRNSVPARALDELSFGLHILLRPFSHRKMKLLLYQFLSLASPFVRVDGSSMFPLICLFVFLLLCPSRAPAALLSRVLAEVHEAATRMP